MGVLAGWGQVLIGIIVSLVQIRLIVTFLPGSLAGVWFLFLSFASYITLFDLGISPTLSREIGFLRARDLGEEPIQQQIADLIATAVRIFEVVALIVFVLAGLIGYWFLPGVVDASRGGVVALAWVICAAGAALNLVGGASFAVLYGLGSVGVERALKSLALLIGFGLTCAALWLGQGLLGLAVAWAIQGAIWRGLAWLALRRLYPWVPLVRGKPSRRLAQRIIPPSLKYAATNFGAVLILGTDNVLIAFTLGTALIPPFEAVARLVNTAMLVSLFAVTSSAPFVSSAHAAGDTAGVVRLLLRNVRLGMGLMLTVVACLGVYGKQVIDIWLGPGQFVGYPVLIAFLIMLTLEAHHVIHATIIMATGRVVFHWLALAAGLLSVLLSLILVQSFGLLGVVLGTLVAQIITNNWYVPVYTLRALGLKFAAYASDVLAPLLFVCILVCAIALSVRSSLSPALPPLVVAVLGCACTGLTGAVASYFLLLEPAERRWLRR